MLPSALLCQCECYLLCYSNSVSVTFCITLAVLVLPSVLLCQCECYLLRYSVSVSIYLLCIMSVLVFTFCVIMSVLELPYVLLVPAGSPSRAGGVVGFFQRHKPTELTHSFLFCCCVCFYLYNPFNCVPSQKFSRQLSAFSLCSSGLFRPYWSFQLYISL